MYNNCFIPEFLTDELLKTINEEYITAGLDFRIEKRELEYMMLCETTNRERIIILSLLVNHFDTHLYTTEKIPISNLNIHGSVDYYIKHDDIRKKIAKNGLERVKKSFTFRDRIHKMFVHLI